MRSLAAALPLSLLGLLAACGAKQSETLPGSSDAGTTTTSADGAATGSDANADAGTVSPAADGGGPRYTWWQDVEPIVHTKCQLCHGTPALYGAPHSLVSYQDTQDLGTSGVPLHQLMAFRVVAPQNAMPPPNQPQLTTAEKQIITTWSEEGAPEGTPLSDAGTASHDASTAAVDAGSGLADAGMVMSNADAGIAMEFLAHAPSATTPYPIAPATTQYICWSFTIPQSMGPQRHMIRFEPLVDNAVHLHHMLLFRNSQHDSPDGPFSCSGFPVAWNMVAGWAPGRLAVDMPPGVGIEVDGGDQFILQAHYNMVTGPAETDQSGIRAIVTDAPNLVNAGMLWAGLIFISPLDGANVSKTYTCTLSTPITVFSDFPHMHQTGTRITLDVQRSGQSSWTNLVDINPWSFDDQPVAPVPPAEQQMQPGDKLRTTCWWNTMGRSIRYGEASQDEMCFNFMYHYPLQSNQFGCVGSAL